MYTLFLKVTKITLNVLLLFESYVKEMITPEADWKKLWRIHLRILHFCKLQQRTPLTNDQTKPILIPQIVCDRGVRQMINRIFFNFLLLNLPISLNKFFCFNFVSLFYYSQLINLVWLVVGLENEFATSTKELLMTWSFASVLSPYQCFFILQTLWVCVFVYSEAVYFGYIYWRFLCRFKLNR